MKQRAVEMSGRRVVEEVFRRNRRVILEEFNREITERGFESNR
jgi:hypothetical protein